MVPFEAVAAPINDSFMRESTTPIGLPRANGKRIVVDSSDRAQTQMNPQNESQSNAGDDHLAEMMPFREEGECEEEIVFDNHSGDAWDNDFVDPDI